MSIFSATQSIQSRLPVSLWYTRCPVPTASSLALDFDWLASEFAPDGIELRSVRSAESRAIRESHFDHTLPGMFREGGNVPALWARGRGHATVVVGLTWVYETQLILTRLQDDDAPASLSELAGRRIGIPQYEGNIVDFTRAMSLRGITSALASVGLTLSDVQLVDIANGEIDLREDPNVGHPVRADVHALLEGHVDAIYFKGPNAIKALDTYALRVIDDLGSHVDLRRVVNNGNPRTITVSRELVQQHPELVARYLAVLVRAANWAKSHQKDVQRVVAQEVGSTVERTVRAYGESVHLHLQPSIDDALIDRLVEQYEFLRELKLIEQPFDVREWVDRDMLRRALQIAESSLPLQSSNPTRITDSHLTELK